MTRAATATAPRLGSAWILIHRYVGLTILAFLALAALTGIVLVFEQDLDAALNPDLFRADGAAVPMSPAELVQRFEVGHPDIAVVKVPLSVAAHRSLVLGVEPRSSVSGARRPLGYDQVFVAPAGGRVLGVRMSEGVGVDRRHAVRSIYELHTGLLAGPWGERFMGVVSIAWLIETLIGLYLTLPRRAPRLRKWGAAWTIQWRGSVLRVVHDLHRATGLWTLVIAVVFAYSSIALALYYELFVPVVTAVSPPHASPFDQPMTPGMPIAAQIDYGRAIAAAVERAHEQGLAWRPAVATYLPDRGWYGVMFTPSGFEEYRALGPITYYFDGRDGTFVYADDVYRDSAGAMVLRSIYPIHSGQLAGGATRWAVLGFGVVCTQTCVTGLWMWWRRRPRARVKSAVISST